jgi:hypothetical protein
MTPNEAQRFQIGDGEKMSGNRSGRVKICNGSGRKPTVSGSFRYKFQSQPHRGEILRLRLLRKIA